MKRVMAYLLVCALSGAAFADVQPAMQIEVPTKARNNRRASFWFHVPGKYNSKRRQPYPVLVYFGGRNCTGKAEASGMLGWSGWADRNDVFLVCPGLKDDNYWEPQKWSGPALLAALAEIGKSYNIDRSRLCYYGYSAGSQAANLFASWRPDLCIAWASHACGVFHEPTARMLGVPGLVTCGDADTGRYVISRDFVSKARRKGIDIIWRSFPNHPHDVPPGSLQLARAFFEHALGKTKGQKKVLFVGDDQENVYYPADSAEAAVIPVEDRVAFVSKSIAEAWGRADSSQAHKLVDESDRISTIEASGFRFALRAPAAFTGKSRIAVIFGGRNWHGEKALHEFRFGDMADREGLFLVSPSFFKGEYWKPETGTGAALLAAIAEVERRYRLDAAPVILYGYSAGGQCAALFAPFMGAKVEAWGAHGCGVYPDDLPKSLADGFVTCGVNDSQRADLSRTFACRYREGGGRLVLRVFPGEGHELSARALDLARAWIADCLHARPVVKWGEDGTLRIAAQDEIDPEFRNPLRSDGFAALWRR